MTSCKRVTAWVLRYSKNCRLGKQKRCLTPLRNYTILRIYWISKWLLLRRNSSTKAWVLIIEGIQSSICSPRHPILDSNNLLRVGGRSQHPLILHGKHPITRLIIHSEHQRLLHAGPTLLAASLCRRYHITGYKRIVCSITRGCITCRRISARPQPQMMGQLPIYRRMTPGSVVWQSWARLVYIKYAHPTVIKAYVCVFVSLSIKTVHLELVSDLTSEAFIATLRLNWQTVSYLEWPWHKFCRRCSRTKGTSWVSRWPEEATENLSFLLKSVYPMEIHSWTCSSFWGSLGSCC